MKKTEKKVALSRKAENNPSNKKLYAVLGGLIVAAVAVFAVSQWCCKPKEIKTVERPQMREDEGIVVAVIDGQRIKLEELEAIKNSIPQLKDMTMDTVYNNLLEGYVNGKVILKAAEKTGIQNRPEIQKAINDAKEQIITRAYIAEQLQARLTQDKIKAIYAEELKNFVPQDEIHARHILVATEKEAKDLIVQLKNGANFEELANKHSLDKNPNMENGGDLGYFRKDMMIPEFANEAFAIKVGKISEKPIRTPFGWHVVKVEDKRKAAPPTIAEVEDLIKARFAETTVPEILAEERSKMQVILLDPLGVNNKQKVVKTPKAEPAIEE
ncbi:MAG: peptidylprolyl isomerase [Alphaproteobacteria bacterium]|nr:peptidylprolyl isomerase [Alphaproteobacteria bacterium]